MFKRLHFLLSDIHLENRSHIKSFECLVKSSPYLLSNVSQKEFKNSTLILAGDIGYPTMDNYWNFLDSCSNTFNKVMFITGNHEYDSLYNENKPYRTIDLMIQNKLNSLKKPNMYFMNMTNIHTNNIRYLGTTLWSDIPKIPLLKDAKFRHNRRQEAFIQQKRWLEEELKKDTITNTIIISHHMPSFKLIDKKYQNSSNYAFATNLEYMIQPNLKYWLCGHTHTPNDKLINGCRYLINPLGKPNEKNKINLISFWL